MQFVSLQLFGVVFSSSYSVHVWALRHNQHMFFLVCYALFLRCRHMVWAKRLVNYRLHVSVYAAFVWMWMEYIAHHRIRTDQPRSMALEMTMLKRWAYTRWSECVLDCFHHHNRHQGSHRQTQGHRQTKHCQMYRNWSSNDHFWNVNWRKKSIGVIFVASSSFESFFISSSRY